MQKREFADRLNRYIKESGLTLRELSKRTSVPVTTIQNWRNGIAATDYLAVKKLAKELGVSLSFLLTGEDDITQTPVKIEDFILDGGELFNGLIEVRIRKILPRERGA